MSKGHLKERMDLLFDVFDLNSDKSMAFEEVFLMLRSTMSCIRKMTGITAPPDRVVMAVTKQIYKASRKHKDSRILPEDWRQWWIHDASARNSLKMFSWTPEDQHGLPPPAEMVAVDYAKIADDSDDPMSALRGAVLGNKGDAGSPGGGGPKPPAGAKTSSRPQRQS